MNYNKFLGVVSCVFAGIFLFSCGNNDIGIGHIDDDKFALADGLYGFLGNYNAPTARVVETRMGVDAVAELYFGITHAVSKVTNARFVLDEAVLEQYNADNGTEFEAYPARFVELSDNGAVSIAPGRVKSAPLKVKIRYSSAVEVGKTFGLPISIASADGLKLKEGGNSYILWIRCVGQTPDTSKPGGIKTVWYFEVNDTNILNAGEWTLADSGIPIADVVCIFAACINYDEATERVKVVCNENIRAILKNRDKYIKPLQDKGIKVTLSILGNWDFTGVANLSDDTARQFARELKHYVDAYGLDGIEFDDEYSQYITSGEIPKGFVVPCSAAYSRLVFETKKLMPDKLVCVYHLGKAGFSNPVDNVNPGDFVDYTYEAFYNRYEDDIELNYKGMSRVQASPYSRKLTYEWNGLKSEFERVRSEGYRVQMLYDYRVDKANSYRNGMSEMTQAFYGANAVWSGISYSKDY